MNTMNLHTPHDPELLATCRRACGLIAPAWPLDRFVAVNPWLGMADRDFTSVATTLHRAAGARMTLTAAEYGELLDQGEIGLDHLAEAIEELGLPWSPGETLERASRGEGDGDRAPVPTVADILEESTDTAWTRIEMEQLSAWAASWFDEGQAAWKPRHSESLYAAWRLDATIDRTPELLGIADFRATISSLPHDAEAMLLEGLRRLTIPADGAEAYLHRLLMRVGGWAAFAARVVWDRRLYHDAEDDTLLEFLAVLVAFEVALYEAFRAQGLTPAWTEACHRLAELGAAPSTEPGVQARVALQLAWEKAVQGRLVDQFETRVEDMRPAGEERPDVQAVFCIDVRSEVFRRHLEATGSGIETLGFAGFFGFPVEFTPLAHSAGAAQCPVLLKPAYRVTERIRDRQEHSRASRRRLVRHEVLRAWESFKMGAISCFSFVGPVGLAYLPKLFTDGFGWSRPVPDPETEGLGAAAPDRDVDLDFAEGAEGARGIPLEDRIELAVGALRGMTLTGGLARLVLLAGHGSTSVNNPHASGLDCGACGGHSGEANARVAAAVLNDAAVRAGVRERGIHIPDDTVFLAGRHDTTTDQLTICNAEDVPASHQADLDRLRERLAAAGKNTRIERSERLLPRTDSTRSDVQHRSRDWAQVRPEWGLAGCSSFIVAPRERTRSLDLGGRAFLHSYVWQEDTDFGILELIMTAPMVVTNWINLQYYASTVDNARYGSGNKTLHNVVGTVGVLEGNCGDLRIGLPWQSVHDGERRQHDPVRLNVVIEAPIEAINDVIARHESVRHLVDNGWLHLFAMDGQGRIARRYVGNLDWVTIEAAGEAEGWEVGDLEGAMA